MSYTGYPAEAANFASKANTLKGEIDTVVEGLNDTSSILSSCSSKDLVVTRSIESIGNIVNKIKPMSEVVTSDINTVNKIATDLENEEYQRILKRKMEEEENNGDVNE